VVEPALQILIDGAISRLGMWLSSLEAEFSSAATIHLERQELGAAHYTNLLLALLANYRRAFDRYRTHTIAPADLRLQWLQQVGAGLAELELLFGRLSVPVAPTLTPMLAAFSRVLERLVPGRPPIFRPVRDFNYELEEFHSSDFAGLLLAGTNKHQWPMLFITLPTGLLDSPRSHILVAHEIGHAVAAVHREKNTTPSSGPAAALTPLLPHPKPARKEVLEIAKERWNEVGLPAPQKPGGPQPTAEAAILLELVAEVGANIDDLVSAWLEELFSDAVGTALFGPAFLVSMLEVLLTTGSLDRGTASHPPLAARLQCIGRTLQHVDMGFTADSFPTNLRSRFETVMANTSTVLTAAVTLVDSTDRLASLVRTLVLGKLDEVVAVAVEHAKRSGLLYTSAQFDSDRKAYVTEFVQTGVPPIGKDISIASVLNVGQVLCSDHLADFCPGVDDVREKERRVDDLLLKAIELNEMAMTWGEAQ
jgi:hypothetical protein